MITSTLFCDYPPLEIALCERFPRGENRYRDRIFKSAYTAIQHEILKGLEADRFKQKDLSDELQAILIKNNYQETELNLMAMDTLIDIAIDDQDILLVLRVLQYIKAQKLILEESTKNSLLSFAKESGVIEFIHFLNSEGFNFQPEIPTYDEYYSEGPMEDLYSLHLAARQGDLSVAAYFLDLGSIVNAYDLDYDSPLSYAALSGPTWGGSFELVQLLVRHGADPSFYISDTEPALVSLLHHLSFNEDLIVLQRFLSNYSLGEYTLKDILRLPSADLKIAAYLIKHLHDFSQLADFFYNRSQELYKEGNYQKGIDCLVLVQKFNPEHDEVHGALSEGYQKLAEAHQQKQKPPAKKASGFYLSPLAFLPPPVVHLEEEELQPLPLELTEEEPSTDSDTEDTEELQGPSITELPKL